MDAHTHTWCLFKPECSRVRSWAQKCQGKAQGTKLGSPAQKPGSISVGAAGAGLTPCSGAGGVQEDAGSVWVPGSCQEFSPLPVPSLDGAPSGLTLLWLLSLLEMLWMIFAAYCHGLAKCYIPCWEGALQCCQHWSLPANPTHLFLCLSSF